MKTSKKLLKNKPKVVIIYGAPAVGKLTVAQELQKITGYILFHNHLIRNLVWDFFARGSLSANTLCEEVTFDFFREFASEGQNVILTHAHSRQYVSITGRTNHDYYKEITKSVKKFNGEVFYVHLIANDETILLRTHTKDRIKHKKLTDISIARENLVIKDWKTSIKEKKHIQIDNTNLSPKKVAQMIKQHFEL